MTPVAFHADRQSAARLLSSFRAQGTAHAESKTLASVSMDSWAMHVQKRAQPSGVLYVQGEACVRAAVAWVGRERVAVSGEMGE
jgi:hypothetical protein